MKDSTLKLLSLSICVNSNANPRITQHNNKIESEQIGNKTECALLEMAYKFGFDYKLYRNPERILKIFPFSSERKKMTTIFRDDKAVYAFSKGAPDFLF
jgi:Ca2+ transporting ATPase